MNVRSAAKPAVGSKPGWNVKRTVIAVVIIAALGGVVWFAVHLGKTSKPARRGFRPTTTVGVSTAVVTNIPITLDALGTVVPAAKVTVIPQVSGVITQILFKEGQMVKKGEALAVIDPRPLQNALQQAQGQLAQAQAQLADAQVLLQRDQTLLAQDSIARQVVDTQAATVKQLQGVVTTDQAAVATARLNLSYSRIVSPVAGRVGLRVVDVGNYIGAGAATGVAVVTQVTPIDVEFTVPQDDIPRIMEQSQESRLPVTAMDRTRTINLAKGTFSTLDNQVDTTTGTVKAKARFGNDDGALFPNQFVNVNLSLQPLQNVVSIPVTAVRSGPNGDFVWVLQADKTVTMRNVVRGPGTATDVSITKGLRACEQVITEGGDRLTEGARVTLPGDRPQAGGPGGPGQRRRRPGAGGAGGPGGQGGVARQGGPGGQGGGDQAQAGGNAGGGEARAGGQGGFGGQRGQGGQFAENGGQGGQFARGPRAGGPGGQGGFGGQRAGGGVGGQGKCVAAGPGQGGRRGPGGGATGDQGQGTTGQGGPGQGGRRGQFGQGQGGQMNAQGQGGEGGGRRGQFGQGQGGQGPGGQGQAGQGQFGGRRGQFGQGQGGQAQGGQDQAGEGQGGGRRRFGQGQGGQRARGGQGGDSGPAASGGSGAGG